MSTTVLRQTMRRTSRRRPLQVAHRRGFTLVELVIVILILGILSAVALPRFVGLGTNARIGVVNATQATLRTAAETAHMRWLMVSGDPGSVTITLEDGKPAYMWYGWPDAGDCCAPDGIEALIDVSKLAVVRLNSWQTRFEVTGAPVSAQCSATYNEASSPSTRYSVDVVTTGC